MCTNCVLDTVSMYRMCCIQRHQVNDDEKTQGQGESVAVTGEEETEERWTWRGGRDVGGWVGGWVGDGERREEERGLGRRHGRFFWLRSSCLIGLKIRDSHPEGIEGQINIHRSMQQKHSRQRPHAGEPEAPSSMCWEQLEQRTATLHRRSVRPRHRLG